MSFSRISLAVSALLLAPLAALAAPAPSPVQIELSHQLDEVRVERLEPLLKAFNDQQKDVHLTLVRRAEGDAPKQINLVTPEEYSRFVASKAKFKPLYEVMREAKQPLDASKLSPELVTGLVDRKGQLFALPVAFSTPVLYINKAAFRKAGLNPDTPPKTWFETQEAAGKLIDSGSKCPFTTSWPASVHIDNLSARNGTEVADAKGKLDFNGLAQIKHVAMLATWYKSKYFIYFGRRDEADRRFASGECGMLTSSSAIYGTLSENKALDVGVSALPYHDDVHGAPQSTLADGASLWIASGLKPAETKGVASFINYVLGPEVQISMTLAGGYLPMTPVARLAASSKLMKADLAGLQVAYDELKGKPLPAPVRVAQITPVRVIVEEELETVWDNKKPAKEALDNAVARGNAVLLAQAQVPAAEAKAGKPGKRHK
ncbi:MAG: extracellular solute-binding protein family 1 [Proteobacteria bacterium]|nr:extracellular solute-binding protein family 1 [Pseudomonadota bacterium]